MDAKKRVNGQPCIDPELVNQAQNAARWIWFRAHISPDQMIALSESIDRHAAPEDCQDRIDHIADACIAEDILRAEDALTTS